LKKSTWARRSEADLCVSVPLWFKSHKAPQRRRDTEKSLNQGINKHGTT
jgi:hypothetical protein